MSFQNPTKILGTIVLVAGLGFAAYRLHCLRSCDKGLVINVNDTQGRNLSSLVEVGLNPNCLLEAAGSDSVLISVKVVPVIAENPNVAVYERVFRLERKNITQQGKLAEIPVPAAEISARVQTDWNNTVWSVGVCNDKNGNSRCDEPGIVQAMRLSGKHVQAMGLSNDSSITFSADRQNGQSCQM